MLYSFTIITCLPSPTELIISQKQKRENEKGKNMLKFHKGMIRKKIHYFLLYFYKACNS